MLDYAIRSATIADAPSIGMVGYAAWLKGIGDLVGLGAHSRISEATFSGFAETSHAEIVVAELNGEVVGFAGTEHGDNCISDVWVAPLYEGRGLGTALVTSLELIIADRGYDDAEIEVLSVNGRALRLYRRLGYTVIWQGDK